MDFSIYPFKNFLHFAPLYCGNTDQRGNLSNLITFRGQRLYFSISISAFGIVPSKTYLTFLRQSEIKCTSLYLPFSVFIFKKMSL